LVAFLVCPTEAAGRFTATFHNPPSPVSYYWEPTYEFSAALEPTSYPVISRSMRHDPTVVGSSFDSSSITFNTQFYSRRGMEQSLVPVTVGAEPYLTYRTHRNVQDKFHKLTASAISNPAGKNREGGLGIKVALPKRLDRIFGEGGAGLKVTGFRKITFSGRSSWTDASSSDTYQQSKFPALNMEQISQFEINGNIGSKIKVRVTQNSQSDIPLANRIWIRWEGDDDDILKTIEAGNTTLSLPRTALVGYSAQVQGLFGIKAAAQLGNLTVTAIASQEKGSADQITVTPGGEESASVIRDNQFAQGRIFDLFYPGEVSEGDTVVNLYVYEAEVNSQNTAEGENAIMVVDPGDTSLYRDERALGITVKQVDPGSYTWYHDRKIPYVVFNSEAGRRGQLGAYIEVKRAGTTGENPGDIETFGDLTSDTLVLRLLRRPNSIATKENRSWRLMWRNCYTVTKGVNIDDLNLKVYKGLAGSENTTNSVDYQQYAGLTQNYLEILGLDQYNQSGQKLPDGRVDDRSEIYRPDWGLIIFPAREPFYSDTTLVDAAGNETMALVDSCPDIYNLSPVNTGQVTASKYYLSLATKTRSSVINLNRANIIEGSERVTVNGRALTRGSDYSIDYDFGRINLISPEATDPNAELAVDFEYAPFLAIQKKTLLGMRAEYEYSKDLKFGTTVLYKSDKAQDRKPRVGQETAKALVYDFDASMAFRPQFLTKAVDALPLVETESPSNFSISGEIAQSRPNPNVDGVAYVDDFESALDQLSLRTDRTSWTKSSKPVSLGPDYVRGQLLWHAPRGAVPVEEVWNREAAQGQGTIRTFRMIFRPRHYTADTSVVNDALEIRTTATGQKSWAGIMRHISGGIDADRVQLLEIRARSRRGKLHFDFGRISEDINGDGLAFSEDGIATQGAQNGAVEEDEDVGLDGLADPDEDFYQYVNDETLDPSHDNWYFLGDGKCPLPGGQCDTIDWDDETVRYEWLNGTEGNIDDPSVQGRPDEEKLSSVGFQTENNYFSYVIDFASDSFRVPGSNSGSSDNQWWTYRIPILDSAAIDEIVTPDTGRPSWSNVTHVRVWFEDDSPNSEVWDTVEVAAWYLVQSNWRDSVVSPDLIPQTNLVVASVGTEDHTFSPPPGVTAYEDPATGVTEPQRGLLMQFENMNNVDTCMAIKELYQVDQYSGYRNMEMYVYGDPDVVAPEGQERNLRFFFRIGLDDNNFYEYRTFVYPGWDPRNYVKFDFNDVTAFKDSLIRVAPKGQAVNIDDSNSVYRVKGQPNLNQIKYFAAGVVNIGEQTIEKGYVWLDELRVTGVRKDVGTAGRLAVSGSLADLITYTFGFDSRDPYFRGISSATRGGGSQNLGSGKSATSYRWSASMNLHNFFPRSWGARLPVTFNYSRSTTTPLLRTSSDVILPEDVRKQEQSVLESRSFSISESFSHKGKNPLFSVLLNRLNTSVTYGRKYSKSVQAPYSFDENLSVRPSFDLTVKGVPRPPIFFWTRSIPIARRISGATLGLYPDNWKLSGSFSRNIRVSDDVNLNRRSTITRDLNARMDLGYRPLDNITTSFSIATKRDLADLDQVNLSLSNLKLGLETDFSQTFSGGYDPKLISWFTTAFGYQSSYGDNWDRTSESRYSRMTRSWNVKGRFDHMAFLGGKGSGGGERRFRGRRNVRGGGEKKDDKDEGSGRPFYDPPLAVLRFLTGWINPPNYSYGESYNASVPGMLQRPTWRYRFGIDRTTEVPTTSQTRTPVSSEGVSYDASSGFSLLGGVSCDVRFSRSISRDVVKQGTRKESISTSWPDLSIRIKPFQTLPLIKGVVNKIIDVFAPRTGYARSTSEERDLDGGFTTQKNTATKYNPLLAVNFVLLEKLSLSGSVNRSKDEGQKFNLSTGEPLSNSRASNKSVAFDAKYSFSAPGGIGIPIFGKLRFRSQVSITLGVKINSSLSETKQRDKPWVTSTDKSDFTWNLILTYSFSRQIKGGLSTRWQDSADNYRNRRSHLREVSLWTEIRF